MRARLARTVGPHNMRLANIVLCFLATLSTSTANQCAGRHASSAQLVSALRMRGGSARSTFGGSAQLALQSYKEAVTTGASFGMLWRMARSLLKAKTWTLGFHPKTIFGYGVGFFRLSWIKINWVRTVLLLEDHNNLKSVDELFATASAFAATTSWQEQVVGIVLCGFVPNPFKATWCGLLPSSGSLFFTSLIPRWLRPLSSDEQAAWAQMHQILQQIPKTDTKTLTVKSADGSQSFAYEDLAVRTKNPLTIVVILAEAWLELVSLQSSRIYNRKLYERYKRREAQALRPS